MLLGLDFEQGGSRVWGARRGPSHLAGREDRILVFYGCRGGSRAGPRLGPLLFVAFQAHAVLQSSSKQPSQSFCKGMEHFPE